jgi:LacI family repressor for deo operon, udp, cdd, tsx, nupC, and nupG
MAGIEDVAKLAGVSTATVSRALSGKDYVSAKALQKVKAAAEELGYVASSSAYSMATGRTRNIGVVVPFVDRWFFSAILESAETIMREQGYDLTLYNLSGGSAQRAKIFNDFLLRKRVDAVLTCAVKLDEAELQSLNRTRKPILGIGGQIEGMRTVSIDDIETGRLATEHLIALGHTNIAMIGGVAARQGEFQQPNLRRQGHVEALKNAGLVVNEAWFATADFTMQGGYHAAKQILGDPRNIPTAVFCAADEMAFGAMLAAKDLGMRVPDDVSIIGIDNHDLADFFGLSTISQKVREQGAYAVQRLIHLIENIEDGIAINVEHNEVWPLELVVRSSTARPKNR